MAELDFIYRRKSVRKFKDEPVPKEDILKLLEAATYAPSPKHQQNWHFVVLQNREIINRMAEIVEESHKKLADLALKEEDKKLFMSFMKYYTLFKNAPVLIVVYGKPYDMIEEKILREAGADESIIEELKFPRSEAQGIGAAVENFMLGAANMGYGTCYMTGPTHARKEIEELLKFEKPNYNLMAMITLGVPADNLPPQPPRKPLEKVVTFID